MNSGKKSLTNRKSITLGILVWSLLALSPNPVFANGIIANLSDLIHIRLGPATAPLLDFTAVVPEGVVDTVALSVESITTPPTNVASLTDIAALLQPTVLFLTEETLHQNGNNHIVTISDLLVMRVLRDQGAVLVSFEFLSDDNPGGLPTDFSGFGRSFTIPETGTLQDVTRFFVPGFETASDAVIANLPILVQVQSDLNPIPAPSTWLLLCSGLAGLALWRQSKA